MTIPEIQEFTPQGQSINIDFPYNLTSPYRLQITKSTIGLIQLSSGETLNKPLQIQIMEEDGYVRAESEALSIFSSGADMTEALRDFESDLIFVWNELKGCDDSELTADAIELRTKLSDYLVNT